MFHIWEGNIKRPTVSVKLCVFCYDVNTCFLIKLGVICFLHHFYKSKTLLLIPLPNLSPAYFWKCEKWRFLSKIIYCTLKKYRGSLVPLYWKQFLILVGMRQKWIIIMSLFNILHLNHKTNMDTVPSFDLRSQRCCITSIHAGCYEQLTRIALIFNKILLDESENITFKSCLTTQWFIGIIYFTTITN